MRRWRRLQDGGEAEPEGTELIAVGTPARYPLRATSR